MWMGVDFQRLELEFSFREWRAGTLSVGSGISFQRCGLEYFDILRWFTAANQRELLCLFSAENDRHQRRRQNSSSVHALRSAGVIIPVLIRLEIWEPEALPGVF
mgnify:CR=1 FL=1